MVLIFFLESQEGLKLLHYKVTVVVLKQSRLESQEGLKHQAEGISLRWRHVWHKNLKRG